MVDAPIDDFRTFELGARGIDYVKEQLAMGNTLADCLMKRVALDNGTVATMLPSTLSDAQVMTHPFEYSILPENRPLGATMVPIPDMNHALLQVIQDYLLTTPEAIVIFEEANRTAEHIPWLRTQPLRVGINDNEVYFLIDRDDLSDPEHIFHTLKEPQSWLWIGVFTSASQGTLFPIGIRSLSTHELCAMADNATRILVGAYDFEGFVIWNKGRRTY